MVFLPKDVVMSAEEAANVIRVSETDPYNGFMPIVSRMCFKCQLKIYANDEIQFLEDWTPAFDARDSVSLKTDEKFTDWYDLFENLGEGKFGKVYRCIEKSTKLELAAKCIRLKRDADKKQVEKEVSFMTRMRHKCIAQIYDAFATSFNEVVLIMEIVQGGELFDRVVEENYILTETAVAMIVYQICEAIRYIHSHNIIHLDLKPENIMCVSQTGNQIKLIDFGLAQYYDGEHDLLFMAGTPEFAAPEVIKFEPLDFHTDMWSVGVIVYILLSGESPFLGDNLALTYYNVERGLWEFCEEFEENGVSEEAKDFINKLLILDKSKRMLPNECLQHPWILNHREKAREIAQSKAEDDSSKIDTTKLRNYVKNKRFRRAVFGVLFINTIFRTFRTLKEKHCESGVKYVQAMLDAVKNEKEKSDEGETPLLERAASIVKRKKIIEEGEPGPSTVISKELDKHQHVDSGLGESSTKVSAIEDEIKILTTNSENILIQAPEKMKEQNLEINEQEKQLEVSSKISGKRANESTTFKKFKKSKKVSSEASQDSLINVLILTEKEAKDVNTRLNQAEALDQERDLLKTTSSSAAVTSTTTATSEDENPPKMKKIIRKKKVPKPVLTLRDVEVPVVKYANDTKNTSSAKNKKKKSSENILENSFKTKFENEKEESPRKKSSDIMENAETQPIQALIARRRLSAKPGGLVGNLLAKLEQKQEQSSLSPMKFAISGVFPKKIPDGLSKPALWAAASDVVKVNGQNAKIEKIEEESKIDEKKSNVEIPIQLERKIVSEKRTSIKKKAIKTENSMTDEKFQQSEKSSVSKCEVAVETKTNIQEGNHNSSNASKALYEKQTKLIEKERSENSTTEVRKMFAEKILDNSQKIGLSQIKTENGKKILESNLKLKDKEENKTIIGAKFRNDEANGAIIVEKKKIQEMNVVINNEEKIAKIETKQKIVATTKPPKPPSTNSTMKKKKIENKNRSLDDMLDKNDNESSLNKKNVTFSNELLDKSEQDSFLLFQRTQSTGNLLNNDEKQNFSQSLDHVSGRKKSLLNPEKIEQLQAQERDAYNFNSLKNLLERRVSGDPPVDEYEQWRKAKADEVRSSIHDSSNVKRAMKKWFSMDKQNQQ